METGNISVVQLTLWLILAAPALLILSAYGLIFLWKRKSQEAAAATLERLHGFQGQHDAVQHFIEEYGTVEEPPYTEQTAGLRAHAAKVAQEIDALGASITAFDEELRTTRIRKFLDIFNAPAHWYRRWRYGSSLRKAADAIADQMHLAHEQMHQIQELPWQLAQQCRQTSIDLAEAAQTAETLRERGVRGSALVSILQRVPEMRQALDEIPPRFFEADRDALLETTSQKVTVRVHAIHEQVRPKLHGILPQLREWDQYHQKSAREFAELKQMGANLRQAVSTPPVGLVVTGLQNRLDQIATTAGEISQRLANPEATSLKSISREVALLRRVIQDTEGMLQRSRQQLDELGQALGELSGGLGQLNTQMVQTERSETFPLVWDASRPRWKDLTEQLEAIGPPPQMRTPEQVQEHLKNTAAIRAEYQALSAQVQERAAQHQELRGLLESPDLREGAAWLGKAIEMLETAGQYDPRNWPKNEMLAALPESLDALAAEQDRLVPVDRQAPVLETSLEKRLQETRRLAEDHKKQRPHVESVRTRLEKVQAMETEGKDRLSAAYTAVERLALLSESNDLVYETASAEAERLIEEIRQVGVEWNARGQGEMEKKLQKISALGEKTNRALNGWLAQVNTAVLEQGRAMSEMLAQIDAAGRLDEPPVIEAHALLARDEYLSALRNPSPGSSTASRLRDAVLQRPSLLGDLEATAEIKRKADFWLMLTAAQRALEEKTGALLTAYQEAVQARTEARERIAEAAKHIPARRAWPPNNQSPVAEAELLKPVEDRWDGMKNGIPRRVETAVLEMGRLTQQYQLVTERANQAINRAEQDEERVRDLEEAILALKQRWQGQAQVDPSNMMIREGVRLLMSRADERLAYIRQQYVRGAISYEETIHNLRLLNDELFDARVPVDEHTDVGLNETPRGISAK
jgi:hypothetical protein